MYLSRRDVQKSARSRGELLARLGAGRGCSPQVAPDGQDDVRTRNDRDPGTDTDARLKALLTLWPPGVGTGIINSCGGRGEEFTQSNETSYPSLHSYNQFYSQKIIIQIFTVSLTHGTCHECPRRVVSPLMPSQIRQY